MVRDHIDGDGAGPLLPGDPGLTWVDVSPADRQVKGPRVRLVRARQREVASRVADDGATGVEQDGGSSNGRTAVEFDERAVHRPAGAWLWRRGRARRREGRGSVTAAGGERDGTGEHGAGDPRTQAAPGSGTFAPHVRILPRVIAVRRSRRHKTPGHSGTARCGWTIPDMRAPRSCRPSAVAPRPTLSPMLRSTSTRLSATVSTTLCAATLLAWLTPALSAQAPAAATPCSVAGTITAGRSPLPGVAITLTARGSATASLAVGSTGPEGSFELVVPGPGEYVLRGELVAFAPIERTLTLTTDECRVRVEVAATLASRQPRPSTDGAAPTASASAPSSNGTKRPTTSQQAAGGRERQGSQAAFQGLTLRADQGATQPGDTTDTAVQLLLPPGFSVDTSADAVTTLAGSRAAEGMGPGERFDPTQFGDGGPEGGQGFPGGPGGGGGFGGPGGGFGGGGVGPGGFGPPGGFRRAADVRAHAQQPAARVASRERQQLGARRGAVLAERAADEQSRATSSSASAATLGGPFTIPKLYRRRHSVVLLPELHRQSFADAVRRVLARGHRGGADRRLLRASTARSSIRRPGQPFPGGIDSRGSAQSERGARAAAVDAHRRIKPAARQNFHYVTTTTTSQDDINVRFVHTFGEAVGRNAPPPGPRRTGVAAGRPEVRAWRRPIRDRRATREPERRHPLPPFEHDECGPVPDARRHVEPRARGTCRSATSFPTKAVDALAAGPVQPPAAETQNLYAVRAGRRRRRRPARRVHRSVRLGRASLCRSAASSSLRDIHAVACAPIRRSSIGDPIVKTRGRHTLRFGGDYRDIRSDSRSDTNARGSFVFTGLYTGARLRRLPARAAAAGDGAVRRRVSSASARRRGTSFVQDDWRARDTVTRQRGPALRVRLAVRGGGQPARARSTSPGIHGGDARAGRSSRPVLRRVPDTIVTADRQRRRAARRRRLAAQAGHDRARRLRHQLQHRRVPDDRAAARAPAAVRTRRTRSSRRRSSPVAFSHGARSAPTGVATTNRTASTRTTASRYVQIWNLDVQRDLTRTCTRRRRLHRHEGIEPRHRARAQPDRRRRCGSPASLPFLWEIVRGRLDHARG